jgi:transcriptional regulator with XRE-family HTH domain
LNGHGGRDSFCRMSIAKLPSAPRTIGDHVRLWRMRRRLSQLDCALDIEMSQRHLSFIESNRAVPSRSMILRIAEHLDVPLRERNAMLLAAGFAPQFRERPLDDPALAPARRAITQILTAHEPYPALAVDRHWTLVEANGAVAPLLAMVTDPALLAPPVNVLRVSLHPQGLAPHIVNLGEWRHHVFDRLRRQIAASADPVLESLLDELRAMPGPKTAVELLQEPQVMVPLRLSTPQGMLNFFSTITVFGTPVEVTLAELALESFYPADAETAKALRRIAEA